MATPHDATAHIHALGTEINMSGTEGARPAASRAGRYYFATDTLRLFRDTGAAWTLISVQTLSEMAGQVTDGQIPASIARDSELHAEDHDHDGTPTQKILAANSHESPAEDTHHAKNHGAAQHTGIGAALSVIATSDTSESLGIGFVDATGLSFSVAADKTYNFEFYVLFTSAATTTGLYLAMNGPASPTAIAYEAKYPFGQTTTSARNVQAYDAGTAATGSQSATALMFAKITGILVNGSTAGTLQVRFQTEVPTSAVVIKAGSGGRLWLMN